MTDEEEFAARSQLKWQRDSDAWILLHRRRRMGRVVPDKDHQGTGCTLASALSAGYLILKLRVVASTVPHKRSVPSDTM
jgi:hypothetical protein